MTDLETGTPANPHESLKAKTLIKRSPTFREPGLAVLKACEGVARDAGLDREAFEERLYADWDSSYAHDPTTTIDELVSNDLLAETLLVDGEPYDGTLEELYSDEGISLESQIKAMSPSPMTVSG